MPNNSIRTSTGSENISGFSFVKSFSVNSSTKKIDTLGDETIEKYMKSPDQVLYKKLNLMLGMINYSGSLYSSLDYKTYSNITFSPGTPYGYPFFHGGYWYVSRLANGIYRSSDLVNWVQVLSTAISVSKFFANGSNIVALVSSSASFYYSSDNGATWQISNYTAPQAILSGIYWKNKWVFFYFDDTYFVSAMAILDNISDASADGEYYTNLGLQDIYFLDMDIKENDDKLIFCSWHSAATSFAIYTLTVLPTGNNWNPTQIDYRPGVGYPSDLKFSVKNDLYIATVGSYPLVSTADYTTLGPYTAYGNFYSDITGKFYFIGYHMFLFQYALLETSDLVNWTDITSLLSNNPNLDQDWKTGERL